MFTPNETLTEPLTDIVKERAPKVTKVAILARNDLFPLAIAQEMEKSAKKRKLDVVFFEKYDIGTLDFASSLTQVKAQSPDWIFATGYTNDLILIRKQMGDLKIGAPVVTMIAAPAYQEFIDSLGELAENVTSAAWWHPAVRYKGEGVLGSSENFVKLWKEKYNAVPDYGEGSAAATGTAFELAIQRAGSIEPSKVRDALASLDVVTFWGPVRFGPDGQIVSLEPPVFQIQDGKHVVIYPPSIKQQDLKWGVK
jgi:branched-chain amino acid transport system substrate-binding protein